MCERTIWKGHNHIYFNMGNRSLHNSTIPYYTTDWGDVFSDGVQDLGGSRVAAGLDDSSCDLHE